MDDDDIDDTDDEEIWACICRAAAKQAGVSVQTATTILEDAGFHAYGHTGIVEAIDVVCHSRSQAHKNSGVSRNKPPE